MSYDFDSNETHDVKIEDVKPLEKRLNVVFKVYEREEEREINSRSGETHRVCDFSVADETGAITLTLWNEDIDAIEIEKVYKLSNGFANVFRNSLRLSKGKFGALAEDSTIFD
jgi:replication factor A1